MKHAASLAISLALLPLLGASAPADPPAAAADAAARGDRDRAEQLARLIQAIRDATHPRQAMSAYARGCAIDRSRPAIHDAYMRRMLQFGLPKIAYYPARVLAAIQPDNGTAWGVVGYVHGQRGQPAEALAATMRAAELAGEDPSVLHNAGQLAAWYDFELDLPKIPDRAKRALDRSRAALGKRAPFAKAYATIQKAYKEQAGLGEQFDEKIAAADADALGLEQLALEIDRKIRDLNDEIEYTEDVIDSLRRDLYYNYSGLYVDPSGRSVYYRWQSPYRTDTRLRIRQQERIIDEVKLKIRSLRREGEGILRDLKAKRDQLEQLQKLRRQAMARVAARFRWDPPAVDGVVTDEIDHLPPPPAEEGSAPEDPESAAEKRLDMARLYIRNDLRERAAEILGEIVKTYGTTKAAEEARVLLAGLKAAK